LAVSGYLAGVVLVPFELWLVVGEGVHCFVS
jgi:hypothetical protein